MLRAQECRVLKVYEMHEIRVQAAKTLRTALSVYLKRTFQPWAARRLQQQDKQQALDSLLPLLDTAYRRLTTHSL